MIRLHQTCGAHTGRTLTFEAGPVRCGRQPGNDLAFDPNADLDASGFHAELVLTGTVWRLTDTQSRNGTWLNGERIVEATLLDGDEIEFGAGGPRVRVELLSADAATARAPSMHTSPRPPVGDRAVLFPPESSATPLPDASFAHKKAQTALGEPLDPVSEDLTPIAPAGKGIRGWLVALLGCSGLLVVGLAIGVGLWWFQRVRTPPPTSADATRIASAHAGALFLVLHTDPTGREQEICAGFAVRRDLIATTARCVYALQAAVEGGHRPSVRPPGGVLQPVTRMYRHPGMPVGAEVGPDVGLLQVSGSAPALTSLSPVVEVAELSDGTAVFVWAAAANGGGLRGGRVTDVGELHGAGPGQLLRHALVGTAGSPMFDREGRVVALHASSVGQLAAPGYGVRIDVLNGLLAGL